MEDRGEILINNENEISIFAQDIKDNFDNTKIITLSGDLGAGKTTLVRHLMRCFDKNIKVTSPTFNIVNTYIYDSDEIWHFDLYKIKDKDELNEIGFYHAIENYLTIIEWPNIALDKICARKLNIKINNTQKINKRIISWNTQTPYS